MNQRTGYMEDKKAAEARKQQNCKKMMNM